MPIWEEHEKEMRMFEIEDIILGMADIVYENRKLRRELEEAKEYKKKYYELTNQSFRNAQESSANLLSAILMGAFNTGDD